LHPIFAVVPQLDSAVLTGDEDAFIRRVAGLIYVYDWERGEAKQRVTQRIEGSLP